MNEISVTESQARRVLEMMGTVDRESWYQSLRELAQEYQWRIAVGMAVTGGCIALAGVAIASMLPESIKALALIEWLTAIPAPVWLLVVLALGTAAFFWFYSMFGELEDTTKLAQQRWFARFVEAAEKAGVPPSAELVQQLSCAPTRNLRANFAAAVWRR